MGALVVREDFSVIACAFDRVFAISGTGQYLWAVVLNSFIDMAPVVAGDGTVYVGSEGNDLVGISPDGQYYYYMLEGSDDTGECVSGLDTLAASLLCFVSTASFICLQIYIN